MELTYVNEDGLSATLRQSRPFFLSKLDGTGNLSNIINTFKSPDQDGAAFVSSTLDMREITIEGTIICDTQKEAYINRKKLLQLAKCRISIGGQHGNIKFQQYSHGSESPLRVGRSHYCTDCAVNAALCRDNISGYTIPTGLLGIWLNGCKRVCLP
jgi:hypothetical protein